MKPTDMQLLLAKIGNNYIKDEKEEFALNMSLFFTNANVEKRKIRASLLYEVIKGYEETRETKRR